MDSFSSGKVAPSLAIVQIKLHLLRIVSSSRRSQMYNKKGHPALSILSIHQFTADNVFTVKMLVPPAHVLNFRRREIRKVVKWFVDRSKDVWLKRLFGHPSGCISPSKVTIDPVRTVECPAG